MALKQGERRRRGPSWGEVGTQSVWGLAPKFILHHRDTKIFKTVEFDQSNCCASFLANFIVIEILI